MAELYINNPSHYGDFIALNEQWIAKYFHIEEADLALAANPGAVIENGGYILSLIKEAKVVGVCALFNQGETCFELARLAVAEQYHGKGFGNRLLTEALAILTAIGAKKVNLMSNTKLTAAFSLYQKHGFHILSQGPHPIYSRTNIMMEKYLQANIDV